MPRNTKTKPDARRKLLDSARMKIRKTGFGSMTVDELCKDAGVTKGAFFHHFKSKEEFGVAAANNWDELTSGFFKDAPYHTLADPLERFLGYIRFRRELVTGDIYEFTCVVGTMVQEIFETSSDIRDACHESMFNHAELLVDDIEAAMKIYPPNTKIDAHSLALHTQAVFQGAFVLAKSTNNAAKAREIAWEMIDHLERYVLLLFGQTTNDGGKK